MCLSHYSVQNALILLFYEVSQLPSEMSKTRVTNPDDRWKNMAKQNLEDGCVRRCRVNVSPQLGRLPATGGGLWCPRRGEEPQSELVGCRGTEGSGEVEARQDWCPWGWGDQERQAGGTLPDWRIRRGEEDICPIHSRPGSLLGSQVRYPALWDQEWGAHLGPFCSLSLSPTPQSPQGLFQPCGSWA